MIGHGLHYSSCSSAKDGYLKKVRLRNTGLKVPLVALGNGSHGGRRESNKTRLGEAAFRKLARHAWDSGIRFFDMADSYGSHSFIRRVLKEVPGGKTTLLTKIWTVENNWVTPEPVGKTLDRYRLETGSDYFDIVFLHCMTNGN